jgi:GT2 family glycosyltransferase
MASERGATYTICGNSDILFTPGWFEPLKRGLEYVDLIGPVTNAPGHCPWQDAKKFGALNTTSDDERILISYAKMLREKPIHCMRVSRINGFFMMAKTKTWWKYAFDNENVFDPRYKLVGNEDEFQIRGLYKGMRIGFSPNSYIFHYRSVSRGLIPGVTENQGAFRRGQ